VARKYEEFCASVVRKISCGLMYSYINDGLLTLILLSSGDLEDSLIGRSIKRKLPLLNYLLTKSRVLVQKTEMCDYKYGL
jgi:hypothetical protein